MVLKPQDVVIILKLLAHPEEEWTYAELARSLAMSPSEVHKGVKRLVHAQLPTPQRSVIRESLKEFAIHGVR